MFRILKQLQQPDPNRYRSLQTLSRFLRVTELSNSYHTVPRKTRVQPHFFCNTTSTRITAQVHVHVKVHVHVPSIIQRRNFSVTMNTNTSNDAETNKAEAGTATMTKSDSSPAENMQVDNANAAAADTNDNQGNGNDNENGNNKKEEGGKRKGKRKSKWGDSKWSKQKRDPNGKANAPAAGSGSGEDTPKNNRNTDNWHSRNAEREEVHPGSFANAEMRKLFGVSLPELDVVADADAKDVKGDGVVQASETGATGDSTAATATAPSTSAENNQDGDGDANQKDEVKLPKRKVAILLQFLGTRYTGMQINEKKNTIQAQIELGLYKAGMLAKTNFGFPKKYSWSNSARTDKGVHSCAQVCSVKIMLPTGDLDKVRELINEQLPDDIRVADVLQVPRSFCARTQRDKVRYQYMLPSFVLQTSKQLEGIFETVLGADRKSRDMKNPFTAEEAKALQQKNRDYRATEENINNLKSALEAYQGTKKFHNYTSGKTWDEANAKRYIISFTVQDRVVDKYGVEWIPTLVVGQSFLLHQIRKMMSHAFDAARGVSSVKTMRDSFEDKYMNINTAPAQGLFLDMSYFDNFNKRKNAGDPLDWHSNESYPASLRWKKFKEDKIMGHIMDEEELQGNFVGYIYQQEHHISLNNYEAWVKKTGRR